MAITPRPHRFVPVHYLVPHNARPFLKLPLACCLGFGSLVSLLLLSSGPVYAEWVEIEKRYQSPGLQTVYFDPDTIRREGSLVTLWQLTDYKWAQGNVGLGRFGVDPSRFLSTKTHKQFDCMEKRLRLLAYAEFLRHMGTGRRNNGYVDQDNWLPVEPDSINQALWEVVCNKE
ncbi:MAG: surface-adhesin E family protein [Nitrospiraceae bacterium]